MIQYQVRAVPTKWAKKEHKEMLKRWEGICYMDSRIAVQSVELFVDRVIREGFMGDVCIFIHPTQYTVESFGSPFPGDSLPTYVIIEQDMYCGKALAYVGIRLLFREE